jgi:hypothetical protein
MVVKRGPFVKRLEDITAVVKKHQFLKNIAPMANSSRIGAFAK